MQRHNASLIRLFVLAAALLLVAAMSGCCGPCGALAPRLGGQDEAAEGESPPAEGEQPSATSTEAPAVEGEATDEAEAQPAEEQPAPGEARSEFEELVTSSNVVVESLTTPDGGVSGEIMAVRLTNPGAEELEFIIPCGFIFLPPPGEQRMIVVQEESVTIGPGQTTDVTMFVMCIDSSAAGASTGATYTIGTMASGDLLAFIECVCSRDLQTGFDPMNPMRDFSLQMAVWAVADGISLDEMQAEMDQAQGAMAEIFGPEGFVFDPEMLEGLPGMEGIDLSDLEGIEIPPEVMETAFQMLEQVQGAAADWLAECGIEPAK